VHLDEKYAKQTIFGRRIAHGMLTASLISAVIAEQLPGHGTVYLSQTLKFIKAVLPGQLVTTTVRVTHIECSSQRVRLDCECKVDEKVVLAGEALVLAPSRKFD
jgi:3-hydroxybutyryl-CoA dehydratase